MKNSLVSCVYPQPMDDDDLGGGQSKLVLGE